MSKECKLQELEYKVETFRNYTAIKFATIWIFNDIELLTLATKID
jgi:hypothetical protein